MRITVPSFAKINWTLEVLGKRTDGFHELLTVLQSISLADQISFEPASGGVCLTTEGRPVSQGPDNLVHKAARLLQAAAETRGGIRVHLKKNVPVGGGLGGGSSNAAVTLLTLNELWGCNLPRKELMRMGAELGSDVPFFLEGGTALCSGRGEKVKPLPDLRREFSILIVYPRFEVSTAEAYGSLDSSPYAEVDLLTRPDLNTTIRRFCEVLEAGEWSALKNDLEGPIFSRHPVLARMKRDLLGVGCEFGMLSGSGSALFAVSSENTLVRGRDLLSETGAVDAVLCQALSREKYVGQLGKAGLDLTHFRDAD